MSIRSQRLAALSLLASLCLAQETVLRSRSELVLVPVSVTDSKGHAVRDLTENDVVLYDNNVPRHVQMEDASLPVSLAIVVQTTPESQFVLDKLRKSTGIFGPMLTGHKGEAAVFAFGNSVRTVQPFAQDEDKVSDAIRRLDAAGSGFPITGAVIAALDLLKTRPADRRRVLLLFAQKHDTSSGNAAIAAAIELAQRENVTVYSIAFSPFKTPFTNRVPQYCDPPAPAFKCRACARTCGNCANQCDRPDGKPQAYVPVQASAEMNLLALVIEMKKLTQVNIGAMLASFTGGEQTEFATRNRLDGVLERISQDLHGQYLLSFIPKDSEPGEYRRLRVEVKGRAHLVVRCRPGYSLAGN